MERLAGTFAKMAKIMKICQNDVSSFPKLALVKGNNSVQGRVFPSIAEWDCVK